MLQGQHAAWHKVHRSLTFDVKSLPARCDFTGAMVLAEQQHTRMATQTTAQLPCHESKHPHTETGILAAPVHSTGLEGKRMANAERIRREWKATRRWYTTACSMQHAVAACPCAHCITRTLQLVYKLISSRQHRQARVMLACHAHLLYASYAFQCRHRRTMRHGMACVLTHQNCTVTPSSVVTTPKSATDI